MPKSIDIRPVAVRLYFLSVNTRMPLKFGEEVLTSVTLARACVEVVDRQGRRQTGWGETPLSVQWVWPSAESYHDRHEALKRFTQEIAELWASIQTWGHPMEIGHAFLQTVLPGCAAGFNTRTRRGKSAMPWLASLLCCAAFDLATHDAYGKLHKTPVYQTYTGEFLNYDLSRYFGSSDQMVSFQNKYPADFFAKGGRTRLKAWHLVGGLDPLEASELDGHEARDGYPVLLRDWIEADGLKCLKIKLRGADAAWDYARIRAVGKIAEQTGVDWLSADFNCTVREPSYVNEIMDRLREDEPAIYGRLLYIEQPFPGELSEHAMNVRSLSGRKPLFLDESAHDWRMVKLGYHLGWTGVALKTCKTQSGAILSGCWARAHEMSLMVQDLTNPALAQVPHLLLAQHFPTIMGVETNAMQFYPEASAPEARVHPGIYQRRDGCVDLGSIQGPGFGYRIEEISRELPAPVADFK